MKIKILMFAHAREIFGSGELELELDDNATIGDAKQKLIELAPKSENLVQRSAFSMNQSYAKDDQLVQADAEIALIPPVSGG